MSPLYRRKNTIIRVTECIRTIWCLLFLILLCIQARHAAAQEAAVPFKSLDISNGLSQNFISTLLQDHRGFMWVGTKDGLNRYDGYSFTIYRNDPYDTSSISDNYITCLYEDDQQNLWIGTRNGGLSLYDRQRDQFRRFPIRATNHAPVSDFVTAITGNSRLGLWIGFNDGTLARIPLPGRNADLFDLYSLEITPVPVPGCANRNKPDISSLLMDEKGLLWIGTNCGIRQLDTHSSNVHVILPDYPAYTVVSPDETLAEPGKGRVWSHEESSPILFEIRQMAADSAGNIWMASSPGVYQYNRLKQAFYLFETANNQVSQAMVRSLAIRHRKNQAAEIWAGLYDGLALLDLKDSGYHYYQHEAGQPARLAPGSVISACIDKTGTAWLGTNGNGISTYAAHLSLFSRAQGRSAGTKDIVTVGQLSLRAFCEIRGADHPRLFLGAQNGLFELTRETGILQKISNLQGKKYEMLQIIYSLAKDHQNNLWIGCGHGLVKYNFANGKLELIPPFDNLSPNDNSVLKIYVDHGGGIWVTTTTTLAKFNPLTKQFKHYAYRSVTETPYAGPAYSVIFEDTDGTFWIGTQQGLLHFDLRQEKFITSYQNDPRNKKSISFTVVNTIVADKKNPERYLWIGTAGGGFNRFDKQEKTFTHFTEKDGLSNNTVYGILGDENGKLWMSTNKGLSVFDPAAGSFKNYDVKNGLQSNEFNTGAFYKSDTGELFFGGIKGFNSFFPEKISAASYSPPLVISGFRLLSSKANEKKNLSFHEKKNIHLSHSDNNFTISLAALDFSSPEKNQYAYRIRNKDTSWISLGNERHVNFTNLSPGKYVFQAKGTNSHGDWSSEIAELTILISPPWWITVWAYAGYAAILIALLWYLRAKDRKRLQLKHSLALEKQQATRLKEMDQVKSRFFANISHEFRTPLTLIMGPMESLRQQLRDEEARQQLDVMENNSHRLLLLINQLLDLSKLESRQLELQFTNGDVLSEIKGIVMSFASLAERKNIHLTIEVSAMTEKKLQGRSFSFSQDAINKIFNNLLSNACKFTSEKGFIKISIDMANRPATAIKVSVSDSGPGIMPEHLSHIFDRFYQADTSTKRHYEGTGIGLSLTKELVELHGGSIEVESSVAEGSRFTVIIPSVMSSSKDYNQLSSGGNRQHILSENTVFTPAAFTTEEETDVNEELPLILIVEDHAELRRFIQSHLGKGFRFAEAIHGKEGLGKALELIPDLVISDVMMPEMDGYEFCTALKTNDLTCHIPVVLLSARADQADRLSGLENGADDYLTKPFSPVELITRVNNLIRLRKMLRQKFSGIVMPGSGEPEINARDKDFLQRLMTYIEENMIDPQFGVETLSRGMNMSQSQLNRKLKAITNQSPVQFIRTIRMEQALKLLQKSPDSIAEVAYETGFDDPGYFTKVFKKHFGFLPSQKENFLPK